MRPGNRLARVASTHSPSIQSHTQARIPLRSLRLPVRLGFFSAQPVASLQKRHGAQFPPLRSTVGRRRLRLSRSSQKTCKSRSSPERMNRLMSKIGAGQVGRRIEQLVEFAPEQQMRRGIGIEPWLALRDSAIPRRIPDWRYQRPAVPEATPRHFRVPPTYTARRSPRRGPGRRRRLARFRRNAHSGRNAARDWATAPIR